MKFKRCSVGGKSYGDDVNDAFNDPELLEDLENSDQTVSYHNVISFVTPHFQADDIREFLLILATCHTVVPETMENGEIKYQSSSPDEGALVRGAMSQGFVFHTRKPKEIVVKTVSCRCLDGSQLNNSGRG